MSDYKIDILEVESQIIAPAATGSVAGLQSPGDKTKIDSVQSGATANSTDAQLRDRATHTGTQTASSISDFSSAAASASPVQSVAGKVGVVALVKADVGLANVDNTSDANKPISSATQTALNSKYDASNPNGYETPAQLNARDTNNKSRANHTGTQTASSISDFSSAADARITAQKGAANGLATLGADSKIPSNQLPAIAISDTFVVASEAAMLALTAQTGDVAVRTDLNRSLILRGTTASVLSDWQELLTPTDAVLSVNGQTGSVNLTTTDIGEGSNLYFLTSRVLATALAGLSLLTGTAITNADTVLSAFGKLQKQVSDNLTTLTNHIANVANPHGVTKAQVGLGNVDNTSDANKPVSTAQQTALNLKANLSGGNAFSGNQTVTGGSVGVGAAAPSDGIIYSVDDTGKDWINEQVGASGSAFFSFRKALGTIASKLALGSGAKIAGFAGQAYNGTGYSPANAEVAFYATEAQTTIASGGELRLNTTPNGTIVGVDRVVVRNNGNIDVLDNEIVNSLTGLTLVNTAVVATDTLKAAIGKLQGQHNADRLFFTSTVLNNSSNVTLTNISDLSMTVVSGLRYRVSGKLVFRSAVTTTGIAFTVSLQGGATGTIAMIAGAIIAGDGTGAKYHGAHTTGGDLVITTSVAAANTDYIFEFDGVFICTASGSLLPQFRSEINGNQITVQIGSHVKVEEY